MVVERKGSKLAGRRSERSVRDRNGGREGG